MKSLLILAKCLLAMMPSFFLIACDTGSNYPLLDQTKLANEHFQEDAEWYVDKIPFFECSDKQIEQVYYCRWKLYKAHIRNVGDNSYVITEFINHMGFDRAPYCTINAASMHHIYEGRWLKDDRYINGYIDYLYQKGGNNLQYSESIADATYARYLVNADSAFLFDQLDSMQRKYNGWSDHWDSTKNLYYIPAMPDATEYNIASIDGSGGTAGFEGGEAFRPTINSYMYGNAMAISRIAGMKGDDAASRDYLQRATALKTTVEQNLWNDSLQHFTDRYKVDNKYVHYWDFIRGRELAGMVPWYFNLPTDTTTFNAAWKHVTDTTHLLGKFGLRTNEPSYQNYFRIYVINFGKPSSQWNGPSWPFQSSLVITGMANLLNNYKQHVITTTDYLKLLRLFTQQHYLPDGTIDLVEDYHPDLGGPIVNFYWSNHYNHSTYNNLVITGLCGIRPSAGDTLDINPLVDSSIQYFCLDDIRYHGHRLSVVYDKEGSKYKLGKGLTVFVDGKKSALLEKDGKHQVFVGAPIVRPVSNQPIDYALNITHKGYPVPSASVNAVPDTALYQAVDGKIWYFTEVFNRWTTLGSTSASHWIALDFGQSREISSIKIYPVADGQTYAAPDSYSVEYKDKDQWLQVKVKEVNPSKPVGNTVNTMAFEKVATTNVRINFKHGTKAVGISEIEVY